ncbi:unnamed protein product [Calypogeia fissa]
MVSAPAPKPGNKTKAQVKAKYESSGHIAGLTLSVGVSDVKLKTSFTDATFINGPSLEGLSLGIEKPGQFMFDYDLAHQSARFQFHTQASVMGKPLKLTYIHPQKRNATLVEGQFVWDPRNKVTAKYNFATKSGSLKYSYHNEPWKVTVEPGYDFNTDAWHFSLGKKLPWGDNLKAQYDTSSTVLGLEWVRDDKYFGSFKIIGSVDVKDRRSPKLIAEKTWDAEF